MCEINNFQYTKNERKAGGDNKKIHAHGYGIHDLDKSKAGIAKQSC